MARRDPKKGESKSTYCKEMYADPDVRQAFPLGPKRRAVVEQWWNDKSSESAAAPLSLDVADGRDTSSDEPEPEPAADDTDED